MTKYIVYKRQPESNSATIRTTTTTTEAKAAAALAEEVEKCTELSLLYRKSFLHIYKFFFSSFFLVSLKKKKKFTILKKTYGQYCCRRLCMFVCGINNAICYYKTFGLNKNF